MIFLLVRLIIGTRNFYNKKNRRSFYSYVDPFLDKNTLWVLVGLETAIEFVLLSIIK